MIDDTEVDPCRLIVETRTGKPQVWFVTRSALSQRLWRILHGFVPSSFLRRSIMAAARVWHRRPTIHHYCRQQRNGVAVRRIRWL